MCSYVYWVETANHMYTIHEVNSHTIISTITPGGQPHSVHTVMSGHNHSTQCYSLAGPVQRSPTTATLDLWITMTLSQQVPDNLQMPLPGMKVTDNQIVLYIPHVTLYTGKAIQISVRGRITMAREVWPHHSQLALLGLCPIVHYTIPNPGRDIVHQH